METRSESNWYRNVETNPQAFQSRMDFSKNIKRGKERWRFEEGRCSTRDVLALIVAGLRGGGWEGSAADLLRAEIAGGPMAAARAAAELLARAFMLPEEG